MGLGAGAAVAGAVKITGAVVGLAMRGPAGLSQGQRSVRVRLGVVFRDAFEVNFSAGFVFRCGASFEFSFAFPSSLSDEVGLDPLAFSAPEVVGMALAATTPMSLLL